MVFKIFKSFLGPPRTSWITRKRLLHLLEPVFILTAVVGLEKVGIKCESDLHDLALLVVLLPVAITLIFLHRKNKLVSLSALTFLLSKVWAIVKKHFYMEVGADFRVGKIEGCHPNQTYREMRYYLAAASIVCAVSLPFHQVFPDGLRILKELYYTPYLVVVTLLWSLLAAAILLALLIVAVLFYHYVLKSPYHNPKAPMPRRTLIRRVHPHRFMVLIGLAAALIGLEVAFGRNGWFWLMGTTVVVTAFLAFVPRSNETMGLLVKRTLVGRIQSISVSEWNFSFYAIIQALSLLLFIVATGAGWTINPTDGDSSNMPVTLVLGRLFGAAMTMATLFYLYATLDYLDIKRLRCDPARSQQKTLCYKDGALPNGLSVSGWQLVPVGHPPGRDDGDLYYDPDAKGQRIPGSLPLVRDPLGISPRDRSFYLDRRDFISKRRAFFRGLQGLMKICHSSSFKDGSGFIMIPHCYFVEGLHRDDHNDDLEENRVIGPTFQKLWGVRVRHFIHNLLDAMDLDIIYFEESIRFNELKAVFEILFELYHSRGPHFKLEEYHFSGLPGVHVLLDLIRPDLPRQENSGYPETYFSNLSQARILIVFKDRGGSEILHPDLTPGIDVDLPAFY